MNKCEVHRLEGKRSWRNRNRGISPWRSLCRREQTRGSWTRRMRRRGGCRRRRGGGRRHRATPERRRPTEEPPWMMMMNLMTRGGVEKERESATAGDSSSSSSRWRENERKWKENFGDVSVREEGRKKVCDTILFERERVVCMWVSESRSIRHAWPFDTIKPHPHAPYPERFEHSSLSSLWNFSLFFFIFWEIRLTILDHHTYHQQR